jgi:hypothetical protein
MLPQRPACQLQIRLRSNGATARAVSGEKGEWAIGVVGHRANLRAYIGGPRPRVISPDPATALADRRFDR